MGRTIQKPMANVYQFKHYLSQIKTGEMAPALSHYLSCFHPLEGEPFSIKIIENFYLRFLHNLRARAFDQSLCHALMDEIKPFFRKNLMLHDLEQIKKTLPYQIIPIENRQEAKRALEKTYQKGSDQVFVSDLRPDQILILVLKEDGRMKVFSHSLVFTIKRGRLHPLPPLSQLIYTSQMDLKPLTGQMVFAPPDQFLRFEKHNLRIYCKTYKMSDFSLIEDKTIQNLKDHSSLFFHLKKIEQNYIQSKSDPHYRELIQDLLNSYQLLISHHNKAVEEARPCLERAREALHFYPQDRLLILLMANIEYRLKSKGEAAFQILTGKPSKDPYIKSALLGDS